MPDTIIRIDGRPNWYQRSPLRIGDPELDTRARQLAQLHLVGSLSRDACVVMLQSGGRSKSITFTRLQLREERGYRAMYYWDEN